MRIALLLLIALLLPMPALAQACMPPTSFAMPHAVTPRDDEPVRQAAIAGYTLALTWAPEYCHGRAERSAGEDGLECGGAFARRFVLHGLWPDAAKADGWPEYCRPAAILPANVIRDNLCATPSPQLLQHEWAKHASAWRAIRRATSRWRARPSARSAIPMWRRWRGTGA